jgi:hypothetical protein
MIFLGTHCLIHCPDRSILFFTPAIIRVEVSWPNLEQRGGEEGAGTGRMATKGEGDQSSTSGCGREFEKSTLCAGFTTTGAQKASDIIASSS